MSGSRRLALDASVLVELMAGSGVVRSLAEELASGSVEGLAARLSLTEAFYVACRLWGREAAEERLLLLLESRVVEIVEDERVWVYAADCKCRLPIALGDCFTLAVARVYDATPLFLRRESELVRVEGRIREWLGREPAYVMRG